MTEVLTFLNLEDCANRVEKLNNRKFAGKKGKRQAGAVLLGCAILRLYGIGGFFWRTSVTSNVSMGGDLDALNV